MHRVVIVAFFSLLFCSCGGTPRAPKEEVQKPKGPSELQKRCDAFIANVDDVWNDEVLAGLELTMKIYTGELDASQAVQLVKEMETFVETWRALRMTTCDNISEFDTFDETKRLSSLDCLENVLHTLSQRIMEFAKGDSTAFMEISAKAEECK